MPKKSETPHIGGASRISCGGCFLDIIYLKSKTFAIKQWEWGLRSSCIVTTHYTHGEENG